MRLRAHDHYTSSTLVEKAEPVQVCFMLHLRDQRNMWMQDGCKVSMDSYMAADGSCFMVTWIIFKNQLLEVGLIQNHETMALRMHNRWCILFYHVWEPPCIEIHWHNIWLRAQSHTTSHYTWGSMTTLHEFGGVLVCLWTLFFWALTISWSRLLARVWSGPLGVSAALWTGSTGI
jgi:hypothetical protein